MESDKFWMKYTCTSQYEQTWQSGKGCFLCVFMSDKTCWQCISCIIYMCFGYVSKKKKYNVMKMGFKEG